MWACEVADSIWRLIPCETSLMGLLRIVIDRTSENSHPSADARHSGRARDSKGYLVSLRPLVQCNVPAQESVPEDGLIVRVQYDVLSRAFGHCGAVCHRARREGLLAMNMRQRSNTYYFVVYQRCLLCFLRVLVPYRWQ